MICCVMLSRRTQHHVVHRTNDNHDYFPSQTIQGTFVISGSNYLERPFDIGRHW